MKIMKKHFKKPILWNMILVLTLSFILSVAVPFKTLAIDQVMDVSGEWLVIGMTITQSGTSVTGSGEGRTLSGTISGNTINCSITEYVDEDVYIGMATLFLSWEQGGRFLRSNGLIHLYNGDDGELSYSIDSLQIFEVSVETTEDNPTEPQVGQSGPENGIFRINRYGIDNLVPLNVAYSLSGSAENGIDYKELSGIATIPAGKDYVDIKVEPIPDGVDDDVETVTLTIIEDGGYLIAEKEATINIEIPKVTISSGPDASEPEKSGDKPGSMGTFTVSRTGSAKWSLEVRYIITGKAGNGTDYEKIDTKVIIPVGKSSETINIKPKYDGIVEGPETVTIAIIPWSGYKLKEPKQGTIMIQDGEDNDEPEGKPEGKPEVNISANIDDINELGKNLGKFYVNSIKPGQETNPINGKGTGGFSISRSGKVTEPLTVYYKVSGKAINGKDYKKLTGIITIPKGKDEDKINITPVNDSLKEGKENLKITLSVVAPQPVNGVKPKPVLYKLGRKSQDSVNIVDAGTQKWTVEKKFSSKQSLTIFFNKKINAKTIKSGISINEKSGKNVAIKIILSKDGYSVLVKALSGQLKKSGTYTLNVKPTIRSKDSLPLSAAYIMTFKTP